VQTGIAAARVFQTLPTGRKLLQDIFTEHQTLLQGSRFKPSYRKYHRWFGAIPNAIALGREKALFAFAFGKRN
jgi:hypothetical protein